MTFRPRSINDILDEIVADIKARPELYDLLDDSKLNNPSQFAIWLQLAGVEATAINIMENLISDAFADLEIRKSQLHPNTLKYIAAESFFYQYGDSLATNDDQTIYIAQDSSGNPVRVSRLHVDYDIYDDTKHIIKAASASAQTGIVILKVAKHDLSDNPIPLSALELSGFTSYWDNKKDAGQSISIISQVGDEIKYTARIEVDGQKISSTGESQTAAGIYPVEDAIRGYFNDLDFEGKLYVLQLEDAIQAVDGVINLKTNGCEAKPLGSPSYVNILSTDDNTYSSIAGFCIEDTTSPLTGTLTYVI